MTKKTAADAGTYNEASIKTLTPREHVRLNVSMYLGTGEDGAYHGAREIIDNSMDEALGGHAKNIVVTLDQDKRGLTVEDDGRGIPHGKSKDTGLSTLASAFGSAFTGGKFKGLKDGYGTSVGVHGIGSKATNFTSELFEAWSFRGDGKQAYVKFSQGLMVKTMKDAEITATKHKGTGTKVHFRPDYAAIFQGAAAFDAKRFRNRLQELSYLSPGTALTFIDKSAGGKEKTYASDKGLIGLIAWRAGTEAFVVDPWVVKDLAVTVNAGDKEATAKVDIALSWVDALDAPLVDAFTNLGPNDEGGTHQKGLEKALASAFLTMAKNKCSTTELFKGMRACIHMKHPYPEFKGQTKNALVNKDVADKVAKALEEPLAKWIRKNKAWVTEFLAAAIEAYGRRSLDKATRSALKDLTPKKGARGILPGKLYEAHCDPSERETFVVEGDSASGNLVLGRAKPLTQEVLPLKGKVINALRADVGKVLANAEFAALVTAVGAGIGDEFDLSKVRQKRVLLLADSDPDGAHITSLLIGFFLEYMRPLVDDGRLYVVDSPLFRASVPNTRKRYYGHTIEDIKAKAGANFDRCEIGRLKGHGEASVEDLEEYALNHATRRLIRVVANAETYARVRAIMSDDVEARKQLLGIAS